MLTEAIKARDIEKVRRLVRRRSRLTETATAEIIHWPPGPPLQFGGVVPVGWHPVHVAASVGDVDIVELLLDAGADPNDTSDLGWTPVRIAAEWGHAAVLERLIASGGRFRDVSDDLGSPLEVASFRGNVETVRLLIAEGADPNAARKNGRTPLIAATLGAVTAWPGATPKERLEVLRDLLVAGADPLATDGDGWTARMHAVFYRSFEIADTVAGEGGWAHLSDAAASGSAAAIEEALNAGALPDAADAPGYRPAGWAALRGSIEAMTQLAIAGADLAAPSVHNRLPIEVAAARGFTALVEFLYDRTRVARRAIGAAAEVGETEATIETVGRLIARGVAPDAQALVDAGRAGNEQTVLLLVNAGVSVDVHDAAGYTALHCAAACGYDDVVRRLLELGASRGERDRDGKTAEDLAVEEGWPEIAAMLGAG